MNEDEDLQRDDDPPVVEEGQDETQEQKEARARARGWRPEEEWDDAKAEREGRKRPVRFLTVDEFLEKTENELPVLRERLRSQDRQLAAVTKKLDEANSKIGDVHKLFKSQQEKHEQQIKRVREQERVKFERQMDESVESGDTTAYKVAKEELKKIDEQETAEEKVRAKPAEEADEEKPLAGQTKRDPEIVAWIKDNTWWDKDMVLTNAMMGLYQEQQSLTPGLSTTEMLDAAKERLREKFPERFNSNQRRRDPAPLMPSGDRQRANGRGRTYDALPAEARAAYDMQKRHIEAMGGKFSKDDYVKAYFSDIEE